MSKTILLADDSLTIQKVVELTFMEEDYQVVAVGNGDEAVTELAELTPALVVADVHMPGASGYEVCRRAKEAHPGVPVLLLVGTFEPFDDADYKSCGADGILKKPFDSQELLRLAGEMVGGGPREPTAPASIAPEPDTGEPDAAEPDTAELESPELPSPEAAFPGPGAADPPRSAVDQATPELPVGGPGTAETALPEQTEEAPALDTAPDLGALELPIEAAPEPPPQEEPATATAAVAPPPADTPAVPAAGETPTSAAGESVEPVALSDEDVDRIARRVVELLGDSTVREVTWDVVPDLAELVIKDRLKELESQVD